MPTCLSFHAEYRCRHSGACCRAGWAIPFAPDERERVQALRLGRGGFDTSGGGPALAARDAGGTCGFFETDSHLCAIHHAGGQSALPLSCRMFPRIVLHDSRGTLISLSHFCPTAAGLLFASGASSPVAIVDAPASLREVGALDGLDAGEAWPPLLRPGVLMDIESYAAWERLGIELLTRDGIAPQASLEALAAATSLVAAWVPGGATPLLHVVRDEFGRLAPPTDALNAYDPAIKRWLAARLFGNWIAYQGNGLAAIVGYLRRCLATFTTEHAPGVTPLEAVRRSDLLILHSA